MIIIKTSKPIASTTLTYLDLDEKGKSMDEWKYKGMIGSLLYLTASRLNIMLSVCFYARYQSNLKESPLTRVKRIIKYLKATTNIGLWNPKGTSLNLTIFLDSDFTRWKLDSKSTSGTCHLLGNSLVSWNCKKQACVALSTTKAKYIVVGSCCSQSLRIKQQLEDFGVNLDQIPLKCGSTSAINPTKNLVKHSRTKHIEIRHNFLEIMC